jgi:hypothetical protein
LIVLVREEADQLAIVVLQYVKGGPGGGYFLFVLVWDELARWVGFGGHQAAQEFARSG